MNLWIWTAVVVLASLIPCGIVCFRGSLNDRLVGLEMTSALVTIELLVLAEGFHRPSFFDLPLTLAFLSFGGGVVFTRFVQRWL